MTTRELERAVDSWATSEPGTRGYGYNDSQNAWNYNPAIDQPRSAFHSFLVRMIRARVTGSVLEIGLGVNGGSHAAFHVIGASVVSVDIDAERVRRYQECNEIDPGREAFVIGDSSDPETLAQVQALRSEYDLLFLDGGDSYEQVARDWAMYSPLVRRGGIIAIVDRSQAWPTDRRMFDVDRFVVELKKNQLDHEGVHLDQVGNGHCIHYYVKPTHREPVCQIPLPRSFVPTPSPERVEDDHFGYAVYAWRGEFLAIKSAYKSLDPRAIERCEYDVILKHASAEGIKGVIETYVAVVPLLEAARKAAVARDVGQAARIVRDVSARYPALRETLMPSLGVFQYQTELLQTLAMACLFGDRCAEGLALARKVLEYDFANADQILLLASVYLHLLEDTDAANELIQEARDRLRETQVSKTCLTQLTGHLLWDFPQFLYDIDRVIIAGGGSVQLLESFSAIDIPELYSLEPNPRSFDLQRRRVEKGLPHDVKLFDIAAGGVTGHQDLWSDAEGKFHSLMQISDGCALREPHRLQCTKQSAEVWALDDLVAKGHMNSEGKNLLIINAEGAELQVLQGASHLLNRVEILCVRVYVDDVYQGVAGIDELREFLDGHGFSLKITDPDSDGVSGHALFAKALRMR